MPVIVWSEKYLVGIPEIDAQHREWVRAINEFYDGLGTPGARLDKLLERASDYTHYHFGEEEKLMQKLGYPELKTQKASHQRITGAIEVFRQRLKTGALVVSLDVTKELRSWFNEHILVEDKALGAFYTIRQAKAELMR